MVIRRVMDMEFPLALSNFPGRAKIKIEFRIMIFQNHLFQGESCVEMSIYS